MEAPSGTIILWKTGAIPTGWSAYAAANGCFLRGVLAGGSVGITGGAGSHTHTAGDAASGGAHTHSSKSFTYGAAGNGVTVHEDAESLITAAVHGHTHTATFSLGSDGAHTHTPATITGGASNLPPYKVGIFIIKD